MNRMKAERLRRGWKQVDVAYHARMNTSEVSRLESGKGQPFPAHARRLAEVLNIPPDLLTAPDAAGAA